MATKAGAGAKLFATFDNGAIMEYLEGKLLYHIIPNLHPYTDKHNHILR